VKRRAGALAALVLSLAAGAAGEIGGSARAVPPNPAAPESSGDEIYRLAKEALGKGSFETAVRLFRALGEDARFEGDARFAFNHAQASRFAGNAGEAVYWYGRYLSLSPSAPDAAAVRSEAAKLAASAPRSIRSEAVKRARAEYARLLADAELVRALDECTRVKLGVRFRRASQSTEGTTYLFRAHAVLFELGSESENAAFVWASADEPVTGPDDGPPLLLIPPGRPLRLPLASDLGGAPVLVSPPQPARFPPDAALRGWTIEVTAALDQNGPPLLLAAAAAGEALAEVRSGAMDAAVELSKKRREIPAVATQLAFGPRAAAPDAKSYAGQRVFVVEIPGKDGISQRWGAPPGAFSVVNAFARLVNGPAGAERICVRPDGQGPFLTPLGVSKPAERR
jgi:hypothetical protein